VEGIAEWQSQSAASQRRVDGGTHLGGGENDKREGSFGLSAVFIGEGKRECWGWRRARLVSHRRVPGSPVLGSLTGGPQSGFEDWCEPEAAPGLHCS
jgi:hypothetical protein